MADGEAVLAGIARAPGVRYAALAPNLKGFERARAARADEIAVFASASEGFSRANLGATIAESLARYAPVAEGARAAGLPLRGYVSCVTDCPFDGEVAPEAVAGVAGALLDMGCHEVSLGDTIGRGAPERVDAMLDAVLDLADPSRFAGHFHDTAGRALDNVEVSLGRGLRVFDAAVGGAWRLPLRARRGGQRRDRGAHGPARGARLRDRARRGRRGEGERDGAGDEGRACLRPSPSTWRAASRR